MKWEKILQNLNVSPGEWAVLSLIGMWPTPKKIVAKTAASHTEGSPLRNISKLECIKALNFCFQKRWLIKVNKKRLEKLKEKLAKRGFLYPIYGFPKIGEIDFTDLGAKIYLKLRKKLLGKSWEKNMVFKIQKKGEEILFFTKRRSAFTKYKELEKKNTEFFLEKPFPIKNLCVYWWEVFEKCFQMNIKILGKSL